MSQDRKERSEKILAELGVAINPNLPVIEDEETAKIRSPKAIVKRAMAALFAANVAIDIGTGGDVKKSVSFFKGLLKRFGIEKELTPDEKKIFYSTDDVTIDEAAGLSWRIEMCVPLLYACGMINKIDTPRQISNVIHVVRNIIRCQDMREVMTYVKMRPASEILDGADLIFRMDWACVDARLKNEEVGGGLDPDVVMEQHKGFNWLIGAYDAEDWDTVLPNT